MRPSRETLDRLKALDAKAARLGLFAPIVQKFERASAVLAAARESGKGIEAARDEAAKLRADRPLVLLVLESRQLIARLRDHVASSEDDLYFRQAPRVDALWADIHRLATLKGAREKAGANRKSDAAERDAQLKRKAQAIRARNPKVTKRALALTLAEKGYGGFEAIYKRLKRLLR